MTLNISLFLLCVGSLFYQVQATDVLRLKNTDAEAFSMQGAEPIRRRYLSSLDVSPASAVVALSPVESQRFAHDLSALDDVLYTTSNSWMEVNYTQLVANAQSVLPQIKKGTIPLAMVKGNGYGLGVLISGKAFLEGGFTELGVGDLREALELRKAGIKAPVHVCYQPDIQSANAIATAPDLQVYAEDLRFVSALCKAASNANRSQPLPVHISVVTGAVREGVRTLPEALDLAWAISNCSALHLRGIMTHHGQLQPFLDIVDVIRSTVNPNIIAHMASSSSHFFDGQQYHLDLVRLGSALYGSRDTSGFRWLTRITGIKQAYAGERLGYSEKPIGQNMTIAMLDVGGVDGADMIQQVVVRGKLANVVGYGGMNMHMINISSIPEAQVDDLVMLSGCCADDNTSLDVPWSPDIRPNVERIEVHGSEGVWMQQKQRQQSS